VEGPRGPSVDGPRSPSARRPLDPATDGWPGLATEGLLCDFSPSQENVETPAPLESVWKPRLARCSGAL
jgi:hypothetical protein